MRVLDGTARKVSLVVLVFSAVAWLIFVVGFGWLESNTSVNDDDDNDDQSYDNFRRTLSQFGDGDVNNCDITLGGRARLPFILFLGGPLLYIIMFIHLLIGHWASGIFAHFGTGAYIAAGGAVLYADGLLISTLNDLLELVGLSVTDFEVGRYIIVEFTGCLVAVLFIIIHMAMWACFTNPWQRRHYGYSLHHDDSDTPTITTTMAYTPVGPIMDQPITIAPMATFPPPGTVIRRQATTAAPQVVSHSIPCPQAASSPTTVTPVRAATETQ